MRVIAGKYRGRNLKGPPSLQVRPTSDRLRETLFNVIAARIEGARFLDLCAGTGAIGIESLSRDAAHVTFVDQSRKMVALIKSNLELCRVSEENYRIVHSSAAEFLGLAAKRNDDPWDLVYFDPPYADDYLPVMELLAARTNTLLAEDGLLIVEHDKRRQLPDGVGLLQRTRVLKQGDSSLSFYGQVESGPQDNDH
jgi:16S rRNA (guanine(966)-N(2))-methyltransferase RsmD